MRKIPSTAYTLVAAALALLLGGCATGNVPTVERIAPVTAVVSGVRGTLHGGQQPISGATVQLYAVGITGMRSAATPLIASTVQTLADGSFSISNDWSCTANTATYGSNPLLYLVATGGNPGLGAGGSNAAISSIAALGACSSLTASTYISMNELTTVAAVYALAPFMADYAHIGGQGIYPAGLVNAFANAATLANTASGTAPGLNLSGNTAVPVSRINTAANLIGACINSNGVGAPCSTLFANATPSGGALPTEVIGALLNLVRNPGLNVSALFNLIPSTAPFQPMLSAPPNDWTLALNITGGGLSAPTGVAIDAYGNAWIANAGGNSVTELATTGAPLTGVAGYSGNNTIFGAQGIAVDRAGNVWLADSLLSTVVELTVSGGTIQSSASFSAGGVSGPTSIAIDSQNNVWVSNFTGGSVTELTSAGAAIGSSPLTANGTLAGPIGVALDLNGNSWIADNTAALVAEFAPGQSLLSGAGYTDSALLAPTAIALDTTGRAWVADSGTNAVSLFSSTGSPLLTTPLTGGGLSLPAAVAIDGGGTVWVANAQTAGSISQLTAASASPLSPATGLGSLNQPAGIAVDPSGSIWTANSGDNSVSVFLGLGTPVVTPLAASSGP